MGLFKRFFSQTRKPAGFLGTMMINRMNVHHAKLSDWGMDFLKINEPDEIADIGCGGGRNAGELMRRFPKAKMTAVDYSPLSVKKALEYNKREIDEGRCVVKQGDVSALELGSGKFDLVTAFETIYFWPGLEKCFSQVLRILKDGGCFMIVNESDGTDETAQKFEKIIDGMKTYTAEQIESALKSAGFSKVKTEHHKSNPWITVLAEK